MKSFIQRAFILLVLFVGVHAPVAHANTDLPPGIIERQQCGSTVVDVRGFGAGLMYQPAPIVPQNDRITEVRPSEGCAVIEWTTPIVATAQVIIAEMGTQPQSVDATEPPYYWYPAGTTQNADAVGIHRVVINNLVPGKTYSYRLVSRSHPSAVPYITEEKFLTVPNVAQTTVPSVPSVPTVPTIVPIVPSHTTATPTIAVTTTTTTPKVTYKTQLVTTTEVVEVSPVPAESVVKNTPETTEFASEVSTEIEPAPVSAITAATSATALTSTENTFWERFSRAFSLFNTNKTGTSEKNASAETALLTVQGNPYEPRTDTTSIAKDLAEEEVAKSEKNIVMSDRYIIPSLFFLILLYLLQQMLLPALGMRVEQPLLFWMFGVVAIAVFAALLKLFYITVFMLAVFLALLAWYILNLFDEHEAVASPQK